MASELEDLREAFHKLATRDFTNLIVSERTKGAADMRERAAKEADMCGEHDIADRIRALPLDGGD